MTVLCGIMVCTTLNMDHRKLRRIMRVVSEIRKEIIDKHVKGKDCKTISKQLHVPVTIVVHIIQKFKVHSQPPCMWLKGNNDDKSKRRIL